MDHRRRAIAVHLLTLAMILASISAPSPALAATCTLQSGVLQMVLGENDHVMLSTDGTQITASGACDFTGEVTSISVSGPAAGDSVGFSDGASGLWNLPIAISGVDEVELHGTEEPDVLDARAFPFTLSGVPTLLIRAYGGADVVTAIPNLQMRAWAGEGDDQVFGSRRSDDVYGEGGNDLVRGERGSDYISGGFGADTLYGDSGTDYLEGGDDDDLLYGGSGDDEIFGGNGDDGLFSGGGTDALDGGDGTDACEGFSTTPPRRSKVTYISCES